MFTLRDVCLLNPTYQLKAIMKKSIAMHSALLLAACLCADELSAAVVTFGFSGTLTTVQNPSNVLSASISFGTPFTGILTYDTSKILGGADADPSTNSGSYYFNSNGGLWFSVNVGGHSFDVTTPSPGDPNADILIYNFSDPQDAFWVDASAPTIRMDGAGLPGSYTVSGMSFLLFDNSGLVYTNDVLPLVPPNLSAFDSHHLDIYAYTPGSGTTFYVTGNITNISAPHPVLQIRPQPNQNVQLGWPIAAQGFILLQNTNLSTSIGWQTNFTAVVDTAVEHTVTVPLANTMFYRLKFP